MIVPFYGNQIYFKIWLSMPMTTMEILCIYTAIQHTPYEYIQCPFKNPSTPQEEEFNKEMSRLRVSVEWVFGVTGGHQ